MSSAAIGLLLADWRIRGIGLNDGATPAALAAFEAAAGVQLTQEFHDFYASADGMDSDSYDDLIFGWWSLEHVLAELRDPEHRPLEAPRALDFADGLIESHRYALVLEGPTRGAIVAHWHGEEPQIAAANLEEFAERFRQAPETVYLVPRSKRADA